MSLEKIVNTPVKHNYLPEQYESANIPKINHNYLSEQFADYKEIFKNIELLVHKGDFTLGAAVDVFEQRICEVTKSKFCIGVGSGTDALLLSLKAAGIKDGDEVITTPYTFFATIGAIVTAGARPVFVDIREDFNLNPNLIEAAITPKTKAILPVHWAGLPCDMDRIMEIAHKYSLIVIEDACHAITATYKERYAGTFGLTGCFSLHPLKNLNVWGDGGYLVTDSQEMHDKLILLRNHGLINRDECVIFAYNSRLDSLQAIVANHLLDKLQLITDARISNAVYYDTLLAQIPQVKTPIRHEYIKQVHHLYCLRVENRDDLQRFLGEHGVDAKVHYPIPMHLQLAAKEYGYERGDFPIAESACQAELSLPVHEFITKDQIDYVVSLIRSFYAR